MMRWSEGLAGIAPAMAKAQSAVEAAEKGSANPAFKREGKPLSYADLASVWAACRAAVKENDLAVIQSPGLVTDGMMHMETMLLHKSGEWIAGELSIPLGKSDAQGYGSATTYARRYALAAMMSVCPEDDDGNGASEAPPQQRQNGKPPSDDGEAKAMIAWVDAHKAKFVAMDGAPGKDAYDTLISDPDFMRDVKAIQKANPSLFAELKHAKDAADKRCSEVPF